MELSYFGTLPNTRSEKSKVVEVRIRRLWANSQSSGGKEGAKGRPGSGSKLPKGCLRWLKKLGGVRPWESFNSLENCRLEEVHDHSMTIVNITINSYNLFRSRNVSRASETAWKCSNRVKEGSRNNFRGPPAGLELRRHIRRYPGAWRISLTHARDLGNKSTPI